ncbi:unnamed protein product [Lymnaea stagnalis]|uniref:Uncharacterized protein n=1 Tax=Lymnaea stagnalis TaxID=6523 RepID=A0AAV2IFL3_LYMST
MSDLKDKVVIITGSSSGIGEAAAILFAQKGSKVTLCGRDQARLQAAFDKCVQAGGGNKDSFQTVQGDVCDPEVRKQIIQQTIDKFGRLDVLVANAGIILEDGTLSNATEAAFDTTMDVNVKSVFFLILEAIPHLEKTQGCIVNVSSTGSVLAFPDEIIYSMSKAAVDHMTRTMAVGLGPKGIRVNAVNPTLVSTNIYRHYGVNATEANTTFLDKYARLHPLHGRASTPEEQAEVIVFLSSKAANFVSGQCILVDGAITLQGAGTN